MADRQSKFVMDAMQATKFYAERWFISEEEINDAVDVAWELAMEGKGTPKSIAWYAIKIVRAGRHFAESVTSIDNPAKRDGKPETRWDVSVLEIARLGDDPAELAAFKIDFDEWFNRLPERKREIVEALAGGMSTSEAATLFGVSWGRISQIRLELRASWDAQFTET